MQIDIPNDDYQKLVSKATAAGYDDVAAFVIALAGDQLRDPRGELDDAQLRASAAECEERHADVQAGRGRDFREAMLQLGRERGFVEGQ